MCISLFFISRSHKIPSRLYELTMRRKELRVSGRGRETRMLEDVGIRVGLKDRTRGVRRGGARRGDSKIERVRLMGGFTVSQAVVCQGLVLLSGGVCRGRSTLRLVSSTGGRVRSRLAARVGRVRALLRLEAGDVQRHRSRVTVRERGARVLEFRSLVSWSRGVGVQRIRGVRLELLIRADGRVAGTSGGGTSRVEGRPSTHRSR